MGDDVAGVGEEEGRVGGSAMPWIRCAQNAGGGAVALWVGNEGVGCSGRAHVCDSCIAEEENTCRAENQTAAYLKHGCLVSGNDDGCLRGPPNASQQCHDNINICKWLISRMGTVQLLQTLGAARS